MKQVILAVCFLGFCVFKTQGQCSFTVNTGNDTTICANQTANLNAVVTPAGAYTFAWTPSATLSSATIANPIASPQDTTTYIVSVTSGGCTVVDSVHVNINGSALVVQATVTPNTVVCPGTQLQLQASIIPTSCGPTPACSGNNNSPVIGSGSIVQSGTGYVLPSFCGNLYESQRNQMLYTAAELQAALGGACTLTGYSFYLGVVNSSAYLLNFTVSLACTNATSLSAFNNNLTQVVAPFPFQPVATNGGRNDLAFSSPYSWDGTSNLVVDICWYDPGTFGNQDNKAVCTTTAANTFIYATSNTADLCGAAVVPTATNLRPNARFSYCSPNISNYNILWTPGTGLNRVSVPTIANPTTNPVSSQAYTVAVGTGACIGYKTVNVTVDTSRVSAGADISSCPGAAVNLAATVVGNILPGPASFTWTTTPGGVVVGNTQNVTVHPNVNTTYIVAMAGGACMHYDTVNVTLGSLNVVATPTNVKCAGQANGKIVITASNGTLPYSYTWSAAANTGNIDSAVGLAPNTYTVTVNDVNSCSGTASATITQPTGLQNSGINLTPEKCFGGSTGSITVTPTGGTTPYHYNWSNSLPAIPNQTALPAGNYTVTTTDANGCTVVSVIPLTQPTAITFNPAVIQNERCANGTTGAITVSATGGTGAYSYSWSQNTGLNSPTATGLAAGPYVVTVKDANQCTVSTTNTITQPAGVSFGAPLIDSTQCFGSSDGGATVNPTGGTLPYTYLWTPSNQTTQTANNLSAQQYTVVVTDDSLCPATTTITIPQPAKIALTGLVSNITCNGNNNGAVVITATTNAYGPVNYRWSTTATTAGITNLSAGNYLITVTDAHSCTASATYTVVEPGILTVNISAPTNVKCAGDATGGASAAGSGGVTPYSYAWSNGATTAAISGLVAATYTVTVKDASLCSVSGSVDITEPPSAPAFGNPTITDLQCNGGSTGSILVTVSGGTPGYTYSWSQNTQLNNPLATGLAAGNYSVTATDANGCSISSTNSVAQPTPVVVGVPQVTDVSCNGGSNGSITVNPSGGAGNPYTFTWNGAAGADPQTGLTAGAYTVVVADANACTASEVINVHQPAAILDSIVAENVRCFGGADGRLTVYPYGGNAPFTYAWSNGPTTQVNDFLSIQSNPYSVTITDNTSCTASATATIAQPTKLTQSHTETQVKCHGDQNGTITAIGAGGTSPYNFSVTKDAANFINAPNGVAMGLDSGLYYIYLSDNFGCVLIDTAYIKSPVADTFDVQVDSTSCYGANYKDGAITITPLVANNLPFTYSIDGGITQDTSYFGNLATGAHHIVATNQFGCNSSIDTAVSQPVQGFASVLPKDTTLHLGRSVTLYSGFGPFNYSSIVSYNWVPSEGLSCADCPNPVATPFSHVSQYTLTITYNGNCNVSDSMTIIVENNLQYFIPNSFTPNGDGNNDVFEIYGAGIKTVKLRVFNRWGELVFESGSQYNGWDGTYKGILQNPGVYTYDAEIYYLDDTKSEKHGSITLIR